MTCSLCRRDLPPTPEYWHPSTLAGRRSGYCRRCATELGRAGYQRRKAVLATLPKCSNCGRHPATVGDRCGLCRRRPEPASTEPCRVPSCRLHARTDGWCVLHEPRTEERPRATDYMRKAVEE